MLKLYFILRFANFNHVEISSFSECTDVLKILIHTDTRTQITPI